VQEASANNPNRIHASYFEITKIILNVDGYLLIEV
jgi:hypothetical protein